jgi:hypothetical protein
VCPNSGLGRTRERGRAHWRGALDAPTWPDDQSNHIEARGRALGAFCQTVAVEASRARDDALHFPLRSAEDRFFDHDRFVGGGADAHAVATIINERRNRERGNDAKAGLSFLPPMVNESGRERVSEYTRNLVQKSSFDYGASQKFTLVRQPRREVCLTLARNVAQTATATVGEAHDGMGRLRRDLGR